MSIYIYKTTSPRISNFICNGFWDSCPETIDNYFLDSTNDKMVMNFRHINLRICL